MTDYRIIPPGDGPEINGSVDWPKDPGFGLINALVQPLISCDNIEHVTVLHDGARCDMFVDDIGRLKGLPRNDRATAIYRNNQMTRHPDTDPESMPFVAGIAVLFYKRVWF